MGPAKAPQTQPAKTLAISEADISMRLIVTRRADKPQAQLRRRFLLVTAW
jgi:hypothetical protein